MRFVCEHLDWCIRNSLAEKTDAENIKTCLIYVAESLNISCFDRINVGISLKYNLI